MSAETWVFLRGLSRESRHWGHFPAIFQHALPEARIHLLDLPGNGLRHRETSPARVEDMTQWCRGELRRAGIDFPCRLLALSLGAMVAVDWAARHPEELGGCVLVNTSLRPFSPFFCRLRPGAYWPLLGLLIPGMTAEAREKVIYRLTSHRPDGMPEVLPDWSAYRRQCPVSSRNALRQLRAAMDYLAPAAKPAPPLLILASRQDALVDPCCSRQLAQRWDSAFAEHPTAGHDLPLDDGPWVADAVRRWLRTPARQECPHTAADRAA